MKRIHEIGILVVLTATAIIHTVTVAGAQTAPATTTAQPAASTQTASQKSWVRALANASNAKNGRMKHKGGIVSTVNGRQKVTYPRTVPAPIK